MPSKYGYGLFIWFNEGWCHEIEHQPSYDTKEEALDAAHKRIKALINAVELVFPDSGSPSILYPPSRFNEIHLKITEDL